jgi:hypothetical protein
VDDDDYHKIYSKYPRPPLCPPVVMCSLGTRNLSILGLRVPLKLKVEAALRRYLIEDVNQAGRIKSRILNGGKVAGFTTPLEM